jgi:hypothetical protein
LPFNSPSMEFYGKLANGRIMKIPRPLSLENCTMRCECCGGLDGSSRSVFHDTVCCSCLWSVQDAAVYIYRIHLPLVFPKVVDGKVIQQYHDCWMCGARDEDTWDHLLSRCTCDQVVRARVDGGVISLENAGLSLAMRWLAS